MSPEDFMNMSPEEADAVLAACKRWYHSRFLTKVCNYFFERAANRGDRKAIPFWARKAKIFAPTCSPPLPSRASIDKAKEAMGVKTELIQTSPTTWEVKTYRRTDDCRRNNCS
jgi:hypothetical protein